MESTGLQVIRTKSPILLTKITSQYSWQCLKGTPSFQFLPEAGALTAGFQVGSGNQFSKSEGSRIDGDVGKHLLSLMPLAYQKLHARQQELFQQSSNLKVDTLQITLLPCVNILNWRPRI